jgi:uncharacterized phage protein (TIGR01671 family)
MGKIKFRVWDKVRKEYFSSGQLLISIEPKRSPKDSHIYLDILTDPDKYNDRFVIERYSEFNDKKGKEIYEGDIISLVTADGEAITITCKFGKVKRQIFENFVEINGFYFERSNDDRKTFPIVCNYLGKHDTEIYEIIGNIHN